MQQIFIRVLTEHRIKPLYPFYKKNNSGLFSELYIQNTSPNPSFATVSFKATTGSSCQVNYSISGKGLIRINIADISCVGSTFIGAAFITASEPIAVTATQFRLNSNQRPEIFMESQYASNVRHTVYAPLYQNYNNGFISASMLQNSSNSTSLITLQFKDGTGATCGSLHSFPNVSPYFSALDSVLPGSSCNTIPSAIISSAYPIAATVNQVRQNTLINASYPAIAYPGKKVIIPVWFNQYNTWLSGVTVQNLDTIYQFVNITFYYPDGSYFTNVWSPNLAPNQNYTFINIPSGSFRGSAVLSSAGPIVAVVDHTVSGTTQDQFASQSGVHR